PGLILKNNLVGLDIDKRATQLASFALVMRARSIDNRFFEEDRYVRPRVYEIIDSKAILNNIFDSKNYMQIIEEYNNNYWKGENKLNSDELKVIEYVVNLFEDAKVIGSLLKVKPEKYLSLRKKLAVNNKNTPKVDIFTSPFFNNEFKQLLELLRLAHFMSMKYDVMITNPPYSGITRLEDKPKRYFTENYKNSKTDMFSMFMDCEFIKLNGFVAMINLQSWMFLHSYKEFRKRLINNFIFINQLHMGRGIFGVDFGSTAFIYRNLKVKKYRGTFFRLHERLFQYIELSDIEKIFIQSKTNNSFKMDFSDYEINGIIKSNYTIGKETVYHKSIYNFLKIPNFSFAYWASDRILEIFESSLKIADYIDPRQGLATTNNNKYLRQWYEVKFNNINFNANNTTEALNSNYKWFPYNKGGAYRKWYGHYDYVVNYENDGHQIKKDVLSKYPYLKTPDFVVKNTEFYFKESITWPLVNSKEFSVRFRNSGSIHDVAGMSAFSNNKELLIYIMGILNTKISSVIFNILNPTINLQVGDFNLFPVIINKEEKSKVIRIVYENISFAKNDWDSFETSWDFSKHPLLGSGRITKLFDEYKYKTESKFLDMKNNEEMLNDYFINLYGLENELNKDVEDNYVSLSIADKNRDVKSLISYLIGVLMGRYSLVKEGLIYAGGRFDFTEYGNYDVDKNGIIPIYSDINVEDGLVHRILGLIKKIYGEDDYRENIGFIAEALGKRNSETNEETLNRYLNDDFYNDHLKTYQKRPIYWMFSSGKLSGFKALIYMHRYDENTLAKLNASYFQPATTILRNQISEIEKLISISGEKEQNQLNKKRLSLVEQLKEAIEYGQVLDYMANQYIKIDLDDGVKVNYEKFQNVKLVSDRGK
ncbi:MAG: BREX-1 system adenine-specific DNA-methyltransferase PglX, partial [Advenella sp.]